jgi:hypothetical protein
MYQNVSKCILNLFLSLIYKIFDTKCIKMYQNVSKCINFVFSNLIINSLKLQKFRKYEFLIFQTQNFVCLKNNFSIK